jgi:hypothetical protein
MLIIELLERAYGPCRTIYRRFQSAAEDARWPFASECPDAASLGTLQGGLENSKISGQKLAWVQTLGY